MRIEAYNKINSIYQTSKVAKEATKVGKTSSYDQVEISRQGQDYQLVKKTLANTPDVRMDRVNDIKTRMASGTYSIKLEEVADKIVESYYDQTI